MRHLLLAFTALLSRSRGDFRTPKHARMGDNCYHVFLDVGSNRGVHGRFYFEPEKYPGSKFAKRFTELIPIRPRDDRLPVCSPLSLIPRTSQHRKRPCPCTEQWAGATTFLTWQLGMSVGI